MKEKKEIGSKYFSKLQFQELKLVLCNAKIEYSTVKLDQAEVDDETSRDSCPKVVPILFYSKALISF